GASRDATQFAVPTYGGTFIYNGSLDYLTTVGVYAAAQPIGVAYHPFDDLVYFARADWNNPASRYVQAHPTSDFAGVAQYDLQNGCDGPGNNAFVEGRLRIARDGSYLFGTVDNGVRFVTVGAPRLVANAQTVRTLEDLPVSFALSGLGSGGNLTYELVSPPAR